MTTEVYIGVGSNLRRPEQRCREAERRLAASPKIQMVGVSSLYWTEPVGYVEQDRFVNGVYHLSTDLDPIPLLRLVQSIESEMGKQVKFRWGPREIDLDLLLYGNEVITRPELQVPHPRMHLRRFVLQPLTEIAPQALHPVFKMNAAELLSLLGEEQQVEPLRK